MIINFFTSLTYRVAMIEFSLLNRESINFFNPILQTKKLRCKASQLYHAYSTFKIPQDLLLTLLRLWSFVKFYNINIFRNILRVFN